jgi:LuxR family transcriptional activator of conjugal transfer of Ti plasmids
LTKAHPIDRKLDTLIDELGHQRDRRGVKRALRKFARTCGFDDFAFVCHGGTELTGISSYDPAWQSHYVKRNFGTTDPVVRLARRHMRPLTWSAKDAAFKEQDRRKFFEQAESFGIRSGLTIPIPVAYGRFAVLSLASADSHASERIEIVNPVCAATAAALTYIRLGEAENHEGGPVLPMLTGRQLSCLSWASFGKTMIETAILLGISENTVRFYLNEAKERLGASNTAHAIRIAVQRGLI